MLAPIDNVSRFINFMFLVIIIGLISALLNTKTGNSGRVNFCMFTVAYAILTDSIYGVFANFISVLAYPILLFVLDILNFIFTFAAATALAVGIRAHSCSNRSYLDSNNIAQGSANRCRQSQAAVAFLYFSMAYFLIKMCMSGCRTFKNGPLDSGMPSFGFSSGRSKRSSAQGVPMPATSQIGVPNISQV